MFVIHSTTFYIAKNYKNIFRKTPANTHLKITAIHQKRKRIYRLESFSESCQVQQQERRARSQYKPHAQPANTFTRVAIDTRLFTDIDYRERLDHTGQLTIFNFFSARLLAFDFQIVTVAFFGARFWIRFLCRGWIYRL